MTKRIPPLHVLAPFAFALFPVASLYSSNLEIPLSRVVPSTIAVLVLAGVVFGVFVAAFKSGAKASTATSLFLILFFSFGLVPLSQSYGLIAYNLLLVAFMAFLFYARRAKAQFVTGANVLAIVAVSVLAAPVVQSGWKLLSWRESTHAAAAERPPMAAAYEPLPDIYHIVLDGYSRADVLEALYKVDNAPFLDALRARGFYVADTSRSNYTMTHLALASMFNLDFVPEYTATDASRYRRTVAERFVKRNRVVDLLRQHGYSFVNIASGYIGTYPNPNADVSIEPPGFDLGEFELSLLQMTPLAEFRVVTDAVVATAHRKRVLFGFDALGRVEPGSSPKFVFAHILCPHPPFVFDENGGPLSLDVAPSLNDANHFQGTAHQYAAGYASQVHFVNRKLIEAIDAILARSDPARRPIIIIQGDHGGGLTYNHTDSRYSSYWERTGILNAFLLPQDGRFQPYDSISPVNTYRVLMNGLFESDLPMLPDKSFYARWSSPWEHIEIPPSMLERPERLDLRDRSMRHSRRAQ